MALGKGQVVSVFSLEFSKETDQWGRVCVHIYVYNIHIPMRMHIRIHIHIREKSLIVRNWFTLLLRTHTRPGIFGASEQAGDQGQPVVQFRSVGQQPQDPGRGRVSVWVWKQEKTDVLLSRQSGRGRSFLGLQLIGRGPPGLGRAVGFPETTNLNVSLTQNPHRNTQNNVGPYSWVPYDPVKLAHKIKHHSGHGEHFLKNFKVNVSH